MHNFIPIYFLVWIAEELKEWYPATSGQEALTLLGSAVKKRGLQRRR